MDSNDDHDGSIVKWIILCTISGVSFWTQAIVTEERFVPALNVIAEHYGISDDVAGATFMAAGASSPELFSSITALFITHSSLGLGTIVGSEIFNQLIICAGAVFAAKTSELKLDAAIVTREVSFYAVAILLLYYALQDVRLDEDGQTRRIYISFHRAFMLFMAYIAYVCVCGNMKRILQWWERKSTDQRMESSSPETIHDDVDLDTNGKLFFLQERPLLKTEPSRNFKTEEDQLIRTNSVDSSHHYLREDASDEENASTPSILQRIKFFLHKEKPSNLHGLEEIESLEKDKIRCFLWQRSLFYNKTRIAFHGWYLRQFTFSPGIIRSVPDRADADKYMVTYHHFQSVDIDERRLLIRITSLGKDEKPFQLLFMAPSKDIFKLVVPKFGACIIQDSPGDSVVEDKANFESCVVRRLTEPPPNASLAGIIVFLCLFPLRSIMHWTLPDVRVIRNDGSPTHKVMAAFLSTLSCLAWLVVSSYAMVTSLERLADMLHIPESVIGVTVSAAGTSLPNYVASRIAAQNGFGNMAVSNAFGSNTFNIMIGLGLPWVMYTSFGTRFEPYDGLIDEGMTTSVAILGSVLLMFIALLLTSNFVLKRWHAILFAMVYIAYIVFEVTRAFY